MSRALRGAALLTLLWPACALADLRSDYREAVAAAERQDWPRVEQLLQRALAERPQADASLRIRIQGQREVAYLPQFYLGLAAFSQRNCTAALAYFDDPGNQAAVRGLREAERQAMMVRSCRAQLAAQSPASAAASPAAAALAATAAAAPAQAPAATRQDAAAAYEQRARQVGDRLVAVETRLQRTRARLAEPALAAGRSEWLRQLDPLLVRAQRARAGYDAAQRSRSAAGLPAVESELAGAESGLARLLAQIDAAPAGGGAALADARGAVLAQVRGRLQPLAAAYLAGDYARAAAWTDEAALTVTPRALAEALLMRAAARYELYVLGGERDLEALERVRTDLRAARAQAPDLDPHERAYSPRFRTLFVSTR